MAKLSKQKLEEVRQIISDHGGVRSQGKVVCEADGPGWLVMMPDGQVVGAASKKDAQRKIKKWLDADLKRHKAGAGVCITEWRS
jgi:hypothetical protein